MNLIISSATIVIGIVGGLYLFREWFVCRKRHTFLLLWAIALPVFYLFQLPFVICNAGITVVLSDYSILFSLAFPFVFLAMILTYLGINLASPFQTTKKHFIVSILWVLAALVVYIKYFLQDAAPVDHEFSVVTALVFFLPAGALIAFTLLRWLFAKNVPKNRTLIFGILFALTATAICLWRIPCAVKSILSLPPSLWLVTVSSSSTILILQVLVGLFYLSGFLLIHKYLHDRRSK